eukprot:scaffold59477_cov61-Phaeocystis_antarctica.AAC.4
MVTVELRTRNLGRVGTRDPPVENNVKPYPQKPKSMPVLPAPASLPAWLPACLPACLPALCPHPSACLPVYLSSHETVGQGRHCAEQPSDQAQPNGGHSGLLLSPAPLV